MEIRSLTPEEALIGLAKAVELRGGGYVQPGNVFARDDGAGPDGGCIVGQALMCLGVAFVVGTDEVTACQVLATWYEHQPGRTRELLRLAMNIADHKVSWGLALGEAQKLYEEHQAADQREAVAQVEAEVNRPGLAELVASEVPLRAVVTEPEAATVVVNTVKF